MNRCLRDMLDSENIVSVIVLANIQARDKINALKTLLDLFAPTPEDRASATAIMAKVGALSGDRNIIAHNMFWPADKKGGVEFVVTKAKGKLNLPKVVWRPKDFNDKIDEMGRLMVEMKKAVKTASRYQKLHAKPRPTVNALQMYASTEGLGLLGNLYLQAHPPQVSAGSQQASPQTSDRKPKAPRKKNPKG